MFHAPRGHEGKRLVTRVTRKRAEGSGARALQTRRSHNERHRWRRRAGAYSSLASAFPPPSSALPSLSAPDAEEDAGADAELAADSKRPFLCFMACDNDTPRPLDAPITNLHASNSQRKERVKSKRARSNGGPCVLQAHELFSACVAPEATSESKPTTQE